MCFVRTMSADGVPVVPAVDETQSSVVVPETATQIAGTPSTTATTASEGAVAKPTYSKRKKQKAVRSVKLISPVCEEGRRVTNVIHHIHMQFVLSRPELTQVVALRPVLSY